MKKIVLFLLILLPFVSDAQNATTARKLTDYEEFTSKTGTLTKILDINMNPLPAPNSKNIKCAIRTVTYNNNRRFYYYIDAHELDYGVAMIPYYDLYDLKKAIKILLEDFDIDSSFEPAHLENKFTTNEHFTLGYIVEGKESKWYIKMAKEQKYCFFKNPSEFKSNIDDAIDKMKKLIKETKD